MYKDLICQIFSLIIIGLYIFSCDKDTHPLKVTQKQDCSGITWKQTCGPYAGTVKEIDFTSSGEMLVVASAVGLLKFENERKIWQNINYRSSVYITDVVLNSKGDIFVGDAHQGIFMSSDDGESWVKKNSGLPNTRIGSLEIDQHDHVYLGIRDSIYRSTDNGKSWDYLNLQNVGLLGQGFAFNQSGHIFFTKFADIYRSTDNGRTWTLINNDLNASFLNDIVINDKGHIFLVGDGISYSTNNGDNWIKIFQIPNTIFYTISIEKNTGFIYVGTGRGIFRSTDDGMTWEDFNQNANLIGVYSISVDENGTIYAGIWAKGLFRYNKQSLSWVQIGLPITWVSSLEMTKNNCLFAGGNDGVFRSINDGNNWAYTGLRDESINVLLELNNGMILAGGLGLYASIDNGENWKKANTTFPDYLIQAFTINRNDNVFLGTFHGPLLRSTDAGNNWVELDIGIRGESINSLTANANGYVFAGISNRGIIRSTNNGESWEPVNAGLTNLFVRCLIVNSRNIIFAGTNDGVFLSTDNGITWQSANLDNMIISTFASSRQGDIFAGTFDQGIFYSSNDGKTWIPVNNGLRHQKIRSFAVSNQSEIFVGTGGGGVYVSNCSSID